MSETSHLHQEVSVDPSVDTVPTSTPEGVDPTSDGDVVETGVPSHVGDVAPTLTREPHYDERRELARAAKRRALG